MPHLAKQGHCYVGPTQTGEAMPYLAKWGRFYMGPTSSIQAPKS